MIRLKDFFIRMCEMENLTAQELQNLTGKSKSVVYEWLNYSNISSFPSYKSLSKIVFNNFIFLTIGGDFLRKSHFICYLCRELYNSQTTQ
jgi:predicted DNA-binding transcriptional regulator AlpA